MGMEYHGTSQIALVGNKIEQGLGIPTIGSLAMLVSAKQRERYIDTYGSMTDKD
jgi:hypothetical protein